MREILFRGKCTDGYGWKYGDLQKIMCPDRILYLIVEPANMNSINCSIFPETIGQFTGITDRDGAKIFEGDIIRVSCGKDRDITGTGTVEFRAGMFGIEWGWHKDFTGFRDFANPLFEVIGNIYDKDGKENEKH